MTRKPAPVVSLANASETTVADALAHWRDRGRSPDVQIRVIARTEIAALDGEIERRRALGLWRTRCPA